jgi:flagellar biosynthesis protein FliQ
MHSRISFVPRISTIWAVIGKFDRGLKTPIIAYVYEYFQELHKVA